MEFHNFMHELSFLLPIHSNLKAYIEKGKKVHSYQRELVLMILKMGYIDFEEILKVIKLIDDISIATPSTYSDFYGEYDYINYLFEFSRKQKPISELEIPYFIGKEKSYFIDGGRNYFKTS